MTRSILQELQELLPELAGRDHFELHVTVNSRLACTVLRLATYIHPPTTERVDPKIPMPTRSISNRMTARPEVSYLGSLRPVVLCVGRFLYPSLAPSFLFSVFYFYFFHAATKDTTLPLKSVLLTENAPADRSGLVSFFTPPFLLFTISFCP